MIFALLFEKFLFDRLSAYLFRWRPALDSGEVVEEAFEAGTASTLTGVAAETRMVTREAFDEPDPLTTGSTTPDAAPNPSSRRHSNG